MGVNISVYCCPTQCCPCRAKDTDTDTEQRSATKSPGHRQCSIEIKNKSSRYTLCYVGVHMVSGFCSRRLPFKIKQSSSGNALFSKTAGTARGAVGVFTYDLNMKSTGKTAGRMAVMFSVPFDFNLSSNWYAVGVFDKSPETDKDLYYQMYNNTGDMLTRKKAGNRIHHKTGPVDISAFMTDTRQPTLTVEVRDNCSKRTESFPSCAKDTDTEQLSASVFLHSFPSCAKDTDTDTEQLSATESLRHRQCSIEITNKSSRYTLRYVGVHMVSGFCSRPLPLEIEPSSSGNALFSKTAGTARGAVGVFTYDLNTKSTGETAGRMAVMFSVPYDYNLYSNWCAVGVFDKSPETDKDLFDQMYKNTGDMFTRKKACNRIDHKTGPVDISAFMTDTCQPTLTVEVRDNCSKRTESFPSCAKDTDTDTEQLSATESLRHRQCSIEITNKSSCYTLRYVGVHMVSGCCSRPLPLEIEPSSSGNALFSKTAGTARGAVGVFTCDLNTKSTGETAGRMAVMFSVPYDYNLYSNWCAVGVFDKSTETDNDLFDQMYKNTGDMFTRKKACNTIDHKTDPVDISAFMTDTRQPTLTVEVRDNCSKSTEK